MKKPYSSVKLDIVFMSASDIITSSAEDVLDLNDFTNGDVVKFGQINS